MATLNFPSSPSPNQLYSANNNVWQWNGTSWISYNSLPAAGSTSIALNSTNEAGTKYVTFVNSSSGSGIALSSDTDLTYVASTNILSAGVFSGNSLIGSTATISSSTNSTTTTTGAIIITGGAGIGQSLSLGGSLQFFNGANYSSFRYSGTANTIYTLPSNTPQSAAGTSVLSSTIAGVMSWVPMTATGSAGVSITAGSGITFDTNGPITSAGKIIARRVHRIQFASSYSPTIGADTAVFSIPFDPNDGTTSMTMRMKRVECRVETSSALGSSFSIQKYAYRGGLGITAFNTDSSVFIGSTTNIMPAFLEIKGADTYETSTTTFAGSHITAVSGDKLRLFFNDVSANHQNFSISLLMEQDI